MSAHFEDTEEVTVVLYDVLTTEVLLVAIYSVDKMGSRNVLRRLKLCNNLSKPTMDLTDYLVNWLDNALIYIAMGKINIVAGLMHSSISP